MFVQRQGFGVMLERVSGFGQRTRDLRLRRRQRMRALERRQRIGIATRGVQRHAEEIPRLRQGRLQRRDPTENIRRFVRMSGRGQELPEFQQQRNRLRGQFDRSAHR